MIVGSLDELPRLEEAFVTIGNFDGLHGGHRKILDSLISDAGKSPKVAITFRKVPIEYLRREAFAGYIFPEGVKERLLFEAGVDYVVNLDFPVVRNMPADDFIARLKEKIKNLHLYIGYDFRFGKDNTADAAFLKDAAIRRGFKLSVIDKVDAPFGAISSSAIRAFIRNGEMERAEACLGRPFFITSQKVAGDRIGTDIGFPTVNLGANRQVLPADGVYYALFATDTSLYPAMAYVGKRPTVNGHDTRIEANLLHYPQVGEALTNGHYYTLFWIMRIRGDKKFPNLEELQKMIYNDRVQILEAHSKRTDFSGLLGLFPKLVIK